MFTHALRGRTACAVLIGLVGYAAFEARASQPWLREVENANLDYLQSGSAIGAAVAAGDYDGDGWTDLVFVGGRPAGMQLYRNLGDRTFENVTSQTIPAGLPWASAVLLLDVDNDGDPDIVYSREANSRSWTGFGYLLNVGGVFVFGGLPDEFARGAGRIGGLAAADVDNDGLLDVYKGHSFGPGFLLMGHATAGFVDETLLRCADMTVERTNWAVAFADYNGDGYQDLHLAIDFFADVQFRNLGNGEFVDVSAEANVEYEGSDMGLAVGDIDNDGDLDIFSSNIRPHALHVNEGAGRFNEESEARGIVASDGFFGIGYGTAFLDIDHDTDLDLLMLDSNVAGLAFENIGNGYFQNVSQNAGSQLSGYGLALFDVDNDGDLDMIRTASVGYPSLFENIAPPPDHGWLVVRPIGTYSNRDSLGARVWVVADGVRMMREAHCGGTFKGGNAKEAYFGLGARDHADLVEVEWPSGMIVRVTDVEKNQTLTLVEPNPDLTGDHVLDLADLQNLLTQFGALGDDLPADFDGNGWVDLADLSSFLTAYARLN